MKIIKKSEWSKIETKFVFASHFPTKITVHHYDSPLDYPKILWQEFFEGAKTIREIQKEHIEKYGYREIGYHYIIAPNGDVYQGRDYYTVGCHVKYNNSGNIGILFIGNFQIEHPTKEQMQSFAKIVFDLSECCSIAIPENIFGHRDFEYTLCPGNNLYSLIFKIKTKEITLYDYLLL